MNTPLSIAIIVAGSNEPSNSAYLAAVIRSELEKNDVQTSFFRLKDIPMQLFTLECYGDSCPHDALDEVLQAILVSDGVIIAMPIWNFSAPAHLKNMIDRLGVVGLDVTHSVGTLNGKPFFLLFTGGAPSAAWALFRRTTSHINEAIRYFGGIVLGTHYEGNCTKGRGQFGLVVDERPATLENVRSKAIEFINTIEMIKKTGLLPLRYRMSFWMIQKAQKVRRWLGI